MKRLLIAFILLFATNAYAGDVRDLVNLGMPAPLAEQIGNPQQTDAEFKTGKTIAIQEGTAASACSGTVTANDTTAVTTTTTCATTGSRIFLTRNAAPEGTAQCWVTNIVDGTSFDIDCSDTEDSTFNWLIVHEAP